MAKTTRTVRLSLWLAVAASSALWRAPPQAWLLRSPREFRGTDRKLPRCTAAIVSVRNVMRRWDSLASVAKAHQLNVNMLIAKGEGIKMTEVSAWADANRQ
jgi:hypothetical protein